MLLLAHPLGRRTHSCKTYSPPGTLEEIGVRLVRIWRCPEISKPRWTALEARGSAVTLERQAKEYKRKY